MKRLNQWTILMVAVLVVVTMGCSAQAKKERHLKRAGTYFTKGEFDKATIEYMNVLRADPTNAVAIRHLGLIFLEQGAPVKAMPFLREAQKMAPNDDELRLKLAAGLLAVGQFSQARAEAEAVLQRAPTNDEALLLLAEASLTADEVLDARGSLETIAAQTGERAAIHVGAAMLSLHEADLVAAEAHAQKALALDPNSSRAHMAMASVLAGQTNLAAAEREYAKAAELAPVRSTIRIKFAEYRARTGAAEEAKRFLGDLTKKAPDYIPAWNLLAQIAVSEKRYDDAVKLVDNVLRRDPANFEGQFRLAQIWTLKDELGKALAELEKLARAYPDVPRVKFHLAQAQLRTTNAVQAVANLNEAIRLDTNYVDAIVLLAELNIRNRDPASAVSSLRALLQQPGAIQSAQEGKRVSLLLADAYVTQGRPSEANTVYEGLLRAYPDDPQLLFLHGMFLRKEGNPAAARGAFEHSLSLSGAHLMTLYQLVDLDIATTNLHAGLERLHQAALVLTNSPGLAYLKAKIYFALRDWDAAETALSGAIEMNPDFSTAYKLLAETYVAGQKLDKAVVQLEGLTAKKPNDVRALMLLALIYSEQKQDQKAAQVYERALSVNPQFAPALNNLAYLYCEQLNRLDRALELAQSAVKLQPDDPAVADTLGWVLYRRGDYNHALPLLEQSVAKLPGNPVVQYHLGMTRYMVGQLDNAKVAFREALKATADFPGKTEAQQKLAALEKLSSVSSSSIPEVEAILHTHPEDLQARMRLAELQEDSGAALKAAETYAEILKRNPSSLKALIRLARLNDGPLQDPQRALALANQAKALAAQDPEVTALLGRLTYRAGDFALAYPLLQQTAQSENAQVLFDFAWAAYGVGRVREAQHTMDKARALELAAPLAEEAKDFLRMISLYLQPEEQGEPRVKELLHRHPDHLPALMALGAIQQEQGNRQTAIQTFEQALLKFPNSVPTQKRLATLYAEQSGTEEKAYALATQVRPSLPGDPELANVLGKLSYRRKEYRYAAQLLQESARDGAANAESLYYLGLAYFQLREILQSKEALEKALGLGLPPASQAHARSLLAQLDGN